MECDRRSFFVALASAGTPVKDNFPRARSRKPLHLDTQLYHGPVVIPDYVAEQVRESPDLHRTAARHLAARLNTPDGTVWLFRARIPASRVMLGEVVRTLSGRIRIHLWATARLGGQTIEEILARHQAEGDV